MRLTNLRLLALAGLTLLASSLATAQSAHVHGAGSLNIAIDASGALLELKVPADDAVGFEYEPKSSEEKAAVAAAIQDLGLDGLFEFNSEASCAVSQFEVEFEVEEDHAEFHAEYEFSCADASAITSVSTLYFELFVGTAELDVQLVSPSGSSTYEWEADSALLSLN